MKVVITGGAGFLGKKLARRLLQGAIAGADGKAERVSELVLFDVGKASGPGLDDHRVKTVAGDIANFATVQSIVQGAATVFHFAAVVSAGAEADFDLGYRVNLDGTRNVLEACRALGTNPRVVFTSSLAAFGGELPPAVTNGINVTARELEQAVGRHAGNRKVGKVVWQHDPAIQKICDGWPQGIDSKRARALGFETDKDLDEIVHNFITDDLDDQMKIAKAA